MSEPIRLGDHALIRGFFKQCMDGLKTSDPEQYCSLCGAVKNEFLNPISGRLSLLDCDCERKLKHFKETIALYRDCYNVVKVGMTKTIRTKYADLIDARVRPANEDEKAIVAFGCHLQGVIQELEHRSRMNSQRKNYLT